MSSTKEKEKVIGDVYFDLETGFGTIAQTLRDARAIDPTIRRPDVERFLARQEQRQTRKPQQNNSFVPVKAPRLQYQVDLADFGRQPADVDDPWFRYGLVAIDIFTKKVAVAPMANKTAPTTAQALDKVVKQLGGPPAEVFSDEGGEFKGAFSERVTEHYQATHRVSHTPPIFVERFIRTLKDNVAKRLQALDDKRWWKVSTLVTRKYNNTEHVTTEVKPNDLTDESLSLEEREEIEQRAWENIARKAHRRRRYPALQVGDSVKLIRKPGKYSEYKAGFVAYSTEVRTVERVSFENGTKLYHLSGLTRPAMRHELLRVEGVDRPPTARLRARQEALEQEEALEGLTDSQLRKALAGRLVPTRRRFARAALS